MSFDELRAAVKPFFSEAFNTAFNVLDEAKQLLLVGAIQDNLDVLADINDYCDVFLETDDMFKEGLASCDFNSDQKQVLSACVDGLQQPGFNDSSQAYADLLESICTSLKVGKGKVFKPIRLALTGRGSGPLITDVLAFFGKERVIERLQLTIA